MDRRRAAGALLALAACIACSAAAPTASNHTTLDLYDGASEGCYYNFQHYGEGDRIMTNEPCLNCTCHNRMLMCYLRVCPFTKPIGQDCTVEKRADQCCPIVTCPDVPVDLLTSTSTSSPAEYGATGLGKLDKYGCSINGKYFPEGSKVPPTPNKPCEHCYCIRNMTTCVMQECTLHVDGCTPIYHKDVCCPVRYSCDHPEDEMPLLDDMSTTVRPTPGFLLTTTTVSPVTQMTQDCVHNDQVIADGASITTEKACEHCYCMKGDIVCVVQECGAPMENEGKNCTSLPPREGQCCPDTYICEGDELSTEISTESTTDFILDKLTTLSPPRRGGVEGSGYRNELSEAVYTETPTAETELEGSGEEEEPTKATDTYEPLLPGKPLEPETMTPSLEESEQYIPVTTKATTFEEPDTTSKEIEPQAYIPTTNAPAHEDEDKVVGGVTVDDNLKPYDHVTVTDTAAESDGKTTGESSDTDLSLLPEQEHEKPHEYSPSTTSTSIIEESSTTTSDENEGIKGTSLETEEDITKSPISEGSPDTEYFTPGPVIPDNIEKQTTEKSDIRTESITEEESAETESYIDSTTSVPTVNEGGSHGPTDSEEVTFADILKDKESSKPEEYEPSTTSIPAQEIEKLTTEPDHALNTVAVAEEGYVYPHIPSSEETHKTTSADLESTITEKDSKADSHEYGHTSTPAPISEESEMFTAEPDKGLNTIPSEIDEESSSQPSLVDRITLSVEAKPSEPSVIIHATESQDVDLKSPTSPETHVTKGDQYTITTEPSFRREDDVRVTTEKPKEEFASTTIKAEFVDEGLIPTSTHDEKFSTGSDASTTDEEITTMLPDYHQELEETIDSKPPTTESVSGASVVSDTEPEIGVTVSSPEVGVPSTTEKTADVTVLSPDVDRPEEPSRIPGEGDCLLNGVTYRNNTIVPSTNNCHTGCKCVSSIIKCDPIICSPPPDYMDNCQSIYDTPDSCCPTYVCDHPRETIPPQSDNQMSGTEPPMPPPVIECRGDQCELSETTKQPLESLKPDQKPETSDCGPRGCEDSAKEPKPASESCAHGECQLPPTHSQVSPSKPCQGDDCKGTAQELLQHCANEEECKKQEIPVSQTVPCQGDSCTNLDCGSSNCSPHVASLPQDNQQLPCKEEDGCKPQEITPPECTGDTPCRRKDTPVEEPPSKCEGDDCASKPFVTQSAVPEQGQEVTEKVELDVEKSTEPAEAHIPEHEILETTPFIQVATEKEYIPTEHTIYETTQPEIKTDEVTPKATEVTDISTGEPTLIEEEDTKKPTLLDIGGTEKATEDLATGTPFATKEDSIQEAEVTKKPEFIDEDESNKEQEIEMPHIVAEEHTSKPALDIEQGTDVSDVDVEKQTSKPPLIEGTNIPDTVEEQTIEPALIDEEGSKISSTIEQPTAKPTLIEEESTKLPGIVDEEQTHKPSLVGGEDTKPAEGVTEEYTDKLDTAEEEATKISVDLVEGYTDEPTIFEEKGTKVPDIIQEEYTSRPDKTEEVETKIPDDVLKEHTGKPTLAAEEGTKMPDVELEEQTIKPDREKDAEIPAVPEEEHTEKLSENEDTKIVDVPETYTNEPAEVTETGTKIPEDIIDDQSGKPALTKGEDKKTPAVIVEEHTSKPVTIEEESTKRTAITEVYTDEPAIIEETSSKLPDIDGEEQTKLTLGYEASTRTPDVVIEKQTDQPTLIKEDGTKTPDVVVEKQTTKPDFGEEGDIKIPDVVEEKQTAKPALTEQEGTKISDVTEGYTDEPSIIDETGTKHPDIGIEEQTKPVLVVEEGTKIPDTVIEGQTGKPGVPDEEGTTIPYIVAEEQTSKPMLIEDEETKISGDIETQTDKPSLIEVEGTKSPDVVVEEQTAKPSLVEEEGTKAPGAVEEHTDLPAVAEDTTIIDGTVHEHKPALEEEQGTIIPETIAEEHTDKPVLVEDVSTIKSDGAETYTEESPILDTQKEVKDKPSLIEQELTEKPTGTKEEPDVKPGLVEEEFTTDHPTLVEEGTEMPESVEISDTNKPMLIDESTLAPAEIDTETKSPASGETSTDTSVMTDEVKDKPLIVEEDTKEPGLVETSTDLIEKEHTDEPQISEVYTDAPKPIEEHEHVPQPPKGEDTRRNEPKKEVKLPESGVEDHTDLSDANLEKVTKAPIIESQTITNEDYSHTDLSLEPVDVQKPEVMVHEQSPDIKDAESAITEPQASTTAVPDAQTHEIVTQSLTEEEKTTVAPLSESVSGQEEDLPSVEQEAYQPPEHVTSHEEPFTNAYEVTKTPELLATTESVNKVTKSTEQETISEQGEIYTDMPEQDSSITKSPIDTIIEPQDGEIAGSPEVTAKIPMEEESSTVAFEKDIIKPVVPESHVTVPVSEQSGTSIVPESELVKTTEKSEVFKIEPERTDMPKPHDIELEKTPIKSSDDVGEQEIKTSEPEIFTPEKEEMITSTAAPAVTEPVKGFTEIEDAYVTGQGEITTGYYAESTDRLEPSATEKTDERPETSTSRSETGLSDAKTTSVPEDAHAVIHEQYTEGPVQKETLPVETEVSAVTESSELSEKMPEHAKPVPEEEDHSTETIVSMDTKKPGTSELPTTELPISIDEESYEKPTAQVENVASQEDKTTKLPDMEISTTSVISVAGEQATTELPESHTSASVEMEQPKPTETSYTEEHVTEIQESDIESEEPKPTDTRRTTTIPDVSEKPTDDQAPELPYTESHDVGKTEQPTDLQKSSTEYPIASEESQTELPHSQLSTEPSMSLVTEQKPIITEDALTEEHDTESSVDTHSESPVQITKKPDVTPALSEVTTFKDIETKYTEQTTSQADLSETTPDLIELEEHTHKTIQDISTTSRPEEEYKGEDIATPSPTSDHKHKPVQELTTSSISEDEHTFKGEEHLSTTLSSIDSSHKPFEDISTVSPSTAEFTTVLAESEPHSPETLSEKVTDEDIKATTPSSGLSEELSTNAAAVSYQTTLSTLEQASEKITESSEPTEASPIAKTTVLSLSDHDKYDGPKEVTTDKSIQELEGTTPPTIIDAEKSPISESDVILSTEKESVVVASPKPVHPDIHGASHATTVPEDELVLSTTKPTTVKQEEVNSVHEDKYSKPEEKPTSEIIPQSPTAEIPKPPADMQPTDEISTPDEDGHFPPSGTGYGEPDYVEEDQAFGPGTCRYGGKVYVSAQQIPRDDPCDFCFCFRSDIICLQQSCPPPIHGCHEEPIQGFCCPRYECPVSMATTVNVTTTTTTTTTTLPPHFPTHSYKGAAQRRGCQIKGHTYKVGEVVRSSSGPCLHCTCGGDGQMKCDPKACTPEPMLRQMIAAAVSAKRRR